MYYRATEREEQMLMEMWSEEYNTIRPHSSLGYTPSAPETFMPAVPEMAGLT
jgi:transposase InsO family protein